MGADVNHYKNSTKNTQLCNCHITIGRIYGTYLVSRQIVSIALSFLGRIHGGCHGGVGAHVTATLLLSHTHTGSDGDLLAYRHIAWVVALMTKLLN